MTSVLASCWDFWQLQKNKTTPDLLNSHPRQAVQTLDCQVRLPTSLPALTSPAPHQSQHRCRARKQQEGKEGREEDVHHMQLPDRSPADASGAVGAAGMHSQAGERAAMTGLISANHKKPLEGFWNKGQLHSQANKRPLWSRLLLPRARARQPLLGGSRAGLCSRVYLKTSTKYLLQQ